MLLSLRIQELVALSSWCKIKDVFTHDGPANEITIGSVLGQDDFENSCVKVSARLLRHIFATDIDEASPKTKAIAECFTTRIALFESAAYARAWLNALILCCQVEDETESGLIENDITVITSTEDERFRKIPGLPSWRAIVSRARQR